MQRCHSQRTHISPVLRIVRIKCSTSERFQGAAVQCRHCHSLGQLQNLSADRKLGFNFERSSSARGLTMASPSNGHRLPDQSHCWPKWNCIVTNWNRITIGWISYCLHLLYFKTIDTRTHCFSCVCVLDCSLMANATWLSFRSLENLLLLVRNGREREREKERTEERNPAKKNGSA